MYIEAICHFAVAAMTIMNNQIGRSLRWKGLSREMIMIPLLMKTTLHCSGKLSYSVTVIKLNPRLKSDLVFNDYVQPISLPAPHTMDTVQMATVIGWGGINPWDPSSDTSGSTNNILSCYLKEAELDITIPSVAGAMMGGACESVMLSWKFQNKICGHRNQTDSCQGDSGRRLLTLIEA